MESFIEEKDGDEIIYKLVVDGSVVSSARTLPYSLLLNIHTRQSEQRKGYGRKLLGHIEKIAITHNVAIMQTTNIDPFDSKAVSFFDSMKYNLKFMKEDTDFLAGTKIF